MTGFEARQYVKRFVKGDFAPFTAQAVIDPIRDEMSSIKVLYPSEPGDGQWESTFFTVDAWLRAYATWQRRMEPRA